MLQAVREDYGPNPYILNLVGPMLAGAVLNTTQALLQGVVNGFKGAGDSNMELYTFPYDDGSRGRGCGGHPNAATHAYMAARLQPLIQAQLGWTAASTSTSRSVPLVANGTPGSGR